MPALALVVPAITSVAVSEVVPYVSAFVLTSSALVASQTQTVSSFVESLFSTSTNVLDDVSLEVSMERFFKPDFEAGVKTLEDIKSSLSFNPSVSFNGDLMNIKNFDVEPNTQPKTLPENAIPKLKEEHPSIDIPYKPVSDLDETLVSPKTETFNQRNLERNTLLSEQNQLLRSQAESMQIHNQLLTRQLEQSNYHNKALVDSITVLTTSIKELVHVNKLNYNEFVNQGVKNDVYTSVRFSQKKEEIATQKPQAEYHSYKNTSKVSSSDEDTPSMTVREAEAKKNISLFSQIDDFLRTTGSEILASAEDIYNSDDIKEDDIKDLLFGEFDHSKVIDSIKKSYNAQKFTI